MKTRLLLLLVAAATLCGCDHSYYKYTYYTFINGTDKTIIVTLYDQTYYSQFLILSSFFLLLPLEFLLRFCRRVFREDLVQI